MAEEAKWYVVHTYSGYENKVKANIEKSVDNRGIGDMIQGVVVPLEDVVEQKSDGTEEIVKRKIYPAYVLIKMVMNDESWFVVRNTRGVTGFVGPGSKPVPLSDEEVQKMGVDTVRRADIKFSVGEHVRLISGPMEGFSGVIDSIDQENRKIKIRASMFGRETLVEVDSNQIESED